MSHDLKSKVIIGLIVLLLVDVPVYYLFQLVYESVEEFELEVLEEVGIEFAAEQREGLNPRWGGYHREFAVIGNMSVISKMFTQMAEYEEVARYPRDANPRASTMLGGYTAGYVGIACSHRFVQYVQTGR